MKSRKIPDIIIYDFGDKEVKCDKTGNPDIAQKKVMHTLKKFVKYYAPYRTVFFLDLICAAIISLVDLAFPQILRSLTKTLFTEDPSQILGALLPIGLALLVMYIIQTFCKYYVSYQGHMMGAHMERDMRQKLFDHYERLSFS